MEEEQERTRIVRRRLSRPQQDRNAARRARRNEKRGLRCNPFSASSRTIRAMTPLQLDRKLNHLRLDTLMVFSEDGVICLGLTGPTGTITLPLSRKLAGKLACQLVQQLSVPTSSR